MPSPLSADRPATEQPEPAVVDALISQTRRLRGGVDAVRREAAADAERTDDPELRWQRALCDLATRHLDTLGTHLGQLREGLPGADPQGDASGPAPTTATAPAGTTPGGPGAGRAGSAEWNLLTDEVTWSEELFELFGRRPQDGALTLDELPSHVVEEDRELLTSLVTGCLVDGRPIDGQFRVLRGDGERRTLHMLGEPVLDADGCTASMWAVLRDVSDLRRGREEVRETRDSAHLSRQRERTEQRLAAELREAVLPPWPGPLRTAPGPDGPDRSPAGGTGLDIAARCLPAADGGRAGGHWFDAMELPGGPTLLTVGGLTGHGVTATSAVAMLIGAVRGMAVTGAEPGPLMGWLDHLLGTSAQPALGSALCCRYDPATGALLWSRAGHPAPLLFRDGTGRQLRAPEGMPLGAVTGTVPPTAAGTAYEQAEERLHPGDVLVLHTEGLAGPAGGPALLRLAPRFSAAPDAQDCLRAVLEEYGGAEREHDACVLIARIAPTG
ncbi:hypothetical protein GCM10010218_45350 [Streptomyces mashuensis]|uniref:PAC domain-containing protein n=1 Tax=Streptomyces mashuensis TaxID=33904 RepID=A0A919EEZ8_9ACTN|nr:SpoIIE family protein phosphatase [Streptomyces mashuensis]GHF58909.1 hypothetical protein GCM10010218_45350 [Streptomyces mashuensis]